MHLSPNTYQGLAFGMTYFDGIETDIRLTRDKKLVIHHDAILNSGQLIENLTLDQVIDQGIPSFDQFLAIPEIVELSKKSAMYIELKPNCNGRSRVVEPIIDDFYHAFHTSIDQSDINVKNINLISFVKDFLDPFTDDYDCFPLLPDVNECSQRFVALKAIPQVLGRSLATEMRRAAKRDFAGVFFARQYIMGFTSFRHPSYDDAIDLAQELDLLLGSNLGDPELEADYPDFARFSDKLAKYPRHAKKGEGPIIAHRGTGTKGVEVPDDKLPTITMQ